MTRRTTKNWTLAGTLALLAACGMQSDAQRGPSVSIVGDTAFLELPVGRSADNGELSVSFDDVTEDSRCPSDVQCVWEGNGGIRLTLGIGEATEVVIINSALDPREVSFAGYTISYRDLSPYPVSEEPFDPGDYLARIAIIDTR